MAAHLDRAIATTRRLTGAALLPQVEETHLTVVAVARQAIKAIDHPERMTQRNLHRLFRTAVAAAVAMTRALVLGLALVPMMTNRGPITGLPTAGPLCRGRRLM